MANPQAGPGDPEEARMQRIRQLAALMPKTSTNTSSSTSQSIQTDLSSGQDAAHKMGQELSVLEAETAADLYGGAVEKYLAKVPRIRKIQEYLVAYGADPNGIEVIPRARIASVSNNSSTSTNTSTG